MQSLHTNNQIMAAVLTPSNNCSITVSLTLTIYIGSLVFLKEDNTALTYNVKSGADALRSGSLSILADLMDPHELDFRMIMGQSFVTNYVSCNDDEHCKQRFLRHFPSWSLLHYSCRFRSNDFELIREMKEKHKDGIATLDRFGRSILHLACDNMQVTGDVIRELLNNDDASVTKKLLYSKTKCFKVSCQHFPSSLLGRARLFEFSFVGGQSSNFNVW